MTEELNNWIGCSEEAKERKTRYAKVLSAEYALSVKNGYYLNLIEYIKCNMRLSLQKMDKRFNNGGQGVIRGTIND